MLTPRQTGGDRRYMAKAATATKPRSKPAPKAAPEDKAIEEMREAVKGLIAVGKERGFITEEELDTALPPDQISSEQREDILARFADMKINITEGEDSDGDSDDGGDSSDDDSAESSTEVSPRAGNVADDDVGRTDDPVRMYLREMGSVELLSREGEIAIAKRIEAGREKMIGGHLRKPADHPGDHQLARFAQGRHHPAARHHRSRRHLCGQTPRLHLGQRQRQR